jgi:hypothetical protein
MGEGGEYLQRENFAALDHGWSLARTGEDSMDLMVSFIHSPFSKHLFIYVFIYLLFCSSGV